MSLQVELVSPERVLYSGEAHMVVCRSLDGEIAFLTGHTPFIGALDIAEVRIYTTPSEIGERAAVHGGFVEVSNDVVTILSDVAELASQIDVDRARRTADELERRNVQEDDEKAEARLRRQHVRIQVAGGLH
jgi:F-type H+-transporting ATPase subunit epsilon